MEWEKWGEIMKRITNEQRGERTERRNRRLGRFIFKKKMKISERERERDKEGQQRRGQTRE